MLLPVSQQIACLYQKSWCTLDPQVHRDWIQRYSVRAKPAKIYNIILFLTIPYKERSGCHFNNWMNTKIIRNTLPEQHSANQWKSKGPHESKNKLRRQGWPHAHIDRYGSSKPEVFRLCCRSKACHLLMDMQAPWLPCSHVKILNQISMSKNVEHTV